MKDMCFRSDAASVRLRIDRELARMAKTLGQQEDAAPFADIAARARRSLLRIERLHRSGRIAPRAHLNCGEDSPGDCQGDVGGRPLRTGVFPVSANPFHWGHLLAGLSAIAGLRLDTVVYIIAGNAPCTPHMPEAAIRHRIGIETLNLFAPYFRYSPLALGSETDGETNLYHLLKLNRDRQIEVFYLAGSDHYRDSDSTGHADTLKMIERNIAGASGEIDTSLHRVTCMRIDRGRRFEVSSAMLRRAFSGGEDRISLALMPYTTYRLSEAFGIYGAPVRPVASAPRTAGIAEVEVSGVTAGA